MFRDLTLLSDTQVLLLSSLTTSINPLFGLPLHLLPAAQHPSASMNEENIIIIIMLLAKNKNLHSRCEGIKLVLLRNILYRPQFNATGM